MDNFFLHVAGRPFRITTHEPFLAGDTNYVPVDCRDVATGMESQALIPEENARDMDSLFRESQFFDCISSVYGNATGDWSVRQDGNPKQFAVRYTAALVWERPPDAD